MGNEIQFNPDLQKKRWVGYFDLLGVKSLFKSNNPPHSVFGALSSAIEKFKKRAEARKNVGYTWFSDTFIVYTDDDSSESFCSIDFIARWFFYYLITNGDGIPIRGAISCDEFYVDRENNLFFGEALIEAYKYGEIQDWIGVILCPSAEEQLKHLNKLELKSDHYAYTDIPLKIGQCYHLIEKLPALILGKWGFFLNENSIIERLSQMKERNVDERIRSKYNRTIEFILKTREFSH